MDRYIADHLITMADGIAAAATPGVVDVEKGRVAWSGTAEDAPAREGATVHHIAGILIQDS